MQDTLPLVRNGLPEQFAYRDEGCQIAPSCLSCPLPQCVHDTPGGVRKAQSEARGAQMLAERLAGLSVGDVAKKYGLSRRHVMRLTGPLRADRQRAAIPLWLRATKAEPRDTGGQRHIDGRDISRLSPGPPVNTATELRSMCPKLRRAIPPWIARDFAEHHLSRRADKLPAWLRADDVEPVDANS